MNCGSWQRRSWVFQRIVWLVPKKMQLLRHCLERHLLVSILDRVSTRAASQTRAIGLITFSGESWAQKALENSDNRGKQLRRDGFSLAEDRYGVIFLFFTK